MHLPTRDLFCVLFARLSPLLPLKGRRGCGAAGLLLLTLLPISSPSLSRLSYLISISSHLHLLSISLSILFLYLIQASRAGEAGGHRTHGHGGPGAAVHTAHGLEDTTSSWAPDEFVFSPQVSVGEMSSSFVRDVLLLCTSRPRFGLFSCH